MGALALADAVRLTFGPRSRRVLIDTPAGPVLSDDGVTIAKALELRDPDASLGARVVREAAERCVALAGDGTTTSILLTAALVAEGIHQIEQGASALGVKRGFDRAARIVVADLQRQSRPADLTRRLQIARISGHHDLETGDIVVGVLRRVGRRGRVTVQETERPSTTVDVNVGLEWNSGSWSSALIPGRGRRRLVLANPRVLVCRDRITLQAVPALCELAGSTGRPLVVVASAVAADALEKLVAAAATSTTPCVPVHAPGEDETALALLEDLSICTGARLIANGRPAALARVATSDLGSARRVIVGTRSTRFVGGGGVRQRVRARVAELRERIAMLSPGEEREWLERRVTGLTGREAVIHVGGRSLIETQSRAEAFDDALNATRAAMAEGVLLGGGLALLRAIPAVSREAEAATDDERAGMLVLLQALEVPARQLAMNAGADPDAVVARLRAGTGTLGFDAQSGRYVDLLMAGILDPTRVVRTAFESAVSVAGMLLLAEGTMTRPATDIGAAPTDVGAGFSRPEHVEADFSRTSRSISSNPDPSATDATDVGTDSSQPEDAAVARDETTSFEDALRALDDAFGGPDAASTIRPAEP